MVNEVFKVYNYVLIHNLYSTVRIKLFFYDLWLLCMVIIICIFMAHVCLLIYCEKLYVIILMEQLL